ncbi:MAG: phospholipase D-like domain-containing protein [Bdellovibrionota bacterium]
MFQVSLNNEVKFFEEGEAYYKHFLKMIADAKGVIHLQTYIFEMDNFGTEVKNELIRASLRGVKVYLLVDAVGSKKLREGVISEFQSAGVFFCLFNEISIRNWVGNWAVRWGRRLHHKILLVDSVALVGGINVISASFGHKNVEPYLDFAVHIDGSVIKDLSKYCETTFRRNYVKPIVFGFHPFHSKPNSHSGMSLKISINDWILRRWQITQQYSHLVRSAKSDIVIINSYFFPRKKFMKQLIAAAHRGVRVRLILPKYSDWPSYVLATQYLYSYFLKNGVEIYQWKKSILHGKLATVDNSSATIGSFNLNYTSYQQNLEMNVDLFSSEFTQNLNRKIDTWIVESCEKIDKKKITKKTTFKTYLAQIFFYTILSLVANFSVAVTVRGLKSE